MSGLSKLGQFALLGIVINTLMDTMEGIAADPSEERGYLDGVEELETGGYIRTFTSNDGRIIHLPGSKAFQTAFELFTADFAHVHELAVLNPGDEKAIDNARRG